MTSPDLSGPERLQLVRLFKDIPLNIPLPTQTLADWVAAHPEVDPEVKVATLDVCRLAGNPASALVLRLLDDRDEMVRLAATRLAAESKPAGALDRLTARLQDPSTSLRERTAIVRALRNAGPSVFAALESAYRTFSDPDFGKTALRALADVDRVQALPLVEAALTSASDAPRTEAVQILGEAPQSALVLGRAFLDHRLGRDELPAVLAALRKFDDKEHRQLVDEVQKQTSQATLSAAEIKARVERGADPWNGLNVYLRETGSRCFNCHKIESVGGSIGPALTGIFQALSADKLIESMLEPSKEIKEGYEPYKVALRDGRVLNGIKVAQDANALVLRDATGQETRIAPSDIDESARDTISIMPVGLVQEYSPQELADLIAFLLSKPAQESLRVRRRLSHFLAIGPFPTGDVSTGVPLDRVESDVSYRGQGGQPVRWVALDASSAGTISLRSQFGPLPGRAYLATRLESPQAQDAALRFEFQGAAQVVLNGKMLTSLRAAEGANPSLTHLPLQKGNNTLIVIIERAVPGIDRERTSFELFSPEPVVIRPNPGNG